MLAPSGPHDGPSSKVLPRLAKVFSRWRSYGAERQSAMRQAIDGLATADLSANTAEVVAMLMT